MKKVKVALAVVVLVMFVWCMTSVVTNMTLHQKVAEPSVGRVEELEDYDSSIKPEKLDEGAMPEGIDCRFGFMKENPDGSYEPVKDPVAAVGSRETFYVTMRVENKTDRNISGLKMFCRLPESTGDQQVVADAMTLSARVEYAGKVAQKQLDLAGKETPISVAFLAGGAGFISENGGELKQLPVYVENDDVRLFDYWQKDGMELSIPAGEKRQIYIGVYTAPVYDIENRAMLYADNAQGSVLVSQTPFKAKKNCHVVNKVTNKSAVSCPINFWVHWVGNIELIPGTVRLNGVKIEDFKPQGGASEGVQNFETVTGGDLRPKETATLEYDVAIGPVKWDETSWIDCAAHAETSGAYTRVECSIKNNTLCVVLLVLTLIFLVVSAVLTVVIWCRQKGIE